MLRFSDHVKRLEKAADDTLGECVLVTPVTKTRYLVGTAHPEISAYELCGIPTFDEASLGPTGTRYKAKQDANIEASNTEISFSLAQFDDLRPHPEKDWILTITSWKSQPKFRVSFARSDGSRLHCIVELTAR